MSMEHDEDFILIIVNIMAIEKHGEDHMVITVDMVNNLTTIETILKNLLIPDNWLIN
jgi:hypothetical protein